MTEMERKQKKNQMLNYFVDRRKKKKPTAMQKAKLQTLEKQKLQKEAEEEATGDGSGEELEEPDKFEKISLTYEHTLFDANTLDELTKEVEKPLSNADVVSRVVEYVQNGQQIDPYMQNTASDNFVRDYADHFVCKLSF